LGRFECPTSTLELARLIAGTRKAFYMALAAALAVHLGLLQIRSTAESERAVKPLTTKFVKREPRLVKPLELKKRPKPKPRPMRRKMVTVRAKISRREMFQTTAHPLKVLDSLARPKGRVARTVSFEPIQLETYIGPAVIEGDKDPEQKVDMDLEMLDIDALDTGEYYAMVIEDPTDKKKIRGFFHLAIAYPLNAAREGTQYDEFPMALRNLVEKLNRWTDIRADIAESFPMSDDRLFRTPFVFFDVSISHRAGGFRLTDYEAYNLGRYMLSGGFYLADDGWPGIGAVEDITCRQTIIDALAAVGKVKGVDWNFERLPNDYLIYHCYYDFNGGPPACGDSVVHTNAKIFAPYPWLEAVIIDNRVVAIMSNKSFQDAWGYNPGVVPRLGQIGINRCFQMGINIIIFALTQEGSITKQVMARVL